MTAMSCLRSMHCLSFHSHYDQTDFIAYFVCTFIAFMDYNGTNQSLLFRAGEKCVTIGILDDLKVERTERFNTYLAIATTTAKVLHGCGGINIYDNDG